MPDPILEALVMAEDVLSRFPFSSEIWPGGVHPQTGISKIREAIELRKSDAMTADQFGGFERSPRYRHADK